MSKKKCELCNEIVSSWDVVQTKDKKYVYSAKTRDKKFICPACNQKFNDKIGSLGFGESNVAYITFDKLKTFINTSNDELDLTLYDDIKFVNENKTMAQQRGLSESDDSRKELQYNMNYTDLRMFVKGNRKSDEVKKVGKVSCEDFQYDDTDFNSPRRKVLNKRFCENEEVFQFSKKWNIIIRILKIFARLLFWGGLYLWFSFLGEAPIVALYKSAAFSTIVFLTCEYIYGVSDGAYGTSRYMHNLGPGFSLFLLILELLQFPLYNYLDARFQNVVVIQLFVSILLLILDVYAIDFVVFSKVKDINTCRKAPQLVIDNWNKKNKFVLILKSAWRSAIGSIVLFIPTEEILSECIAAVGIIYLVYGAIRFFVSHTYNRQRLIICAAVVIICFIQHNLRIEIFCFKMSRYKSGIDDSNMKHKKCDYCKTIIKGYDYVIVGMRELCICSNCLKTVMPKMPYRIKEDITIDDIVAYNEHKKIFNANKSRFEKGQRLSVHAGVNTRNEFGLCFDNKNRLLLIGDGFYGIDDIVVSYDDVKLKLALDKTYDFFDTIKEDERYGWYYKGMSSYDERGNADLFVGKKYIDEIPKNMKSLVMLQVESDTYDELNHIFYVEAGEISVCRIESIKKKTCYDFVKTGEIYWDYEYNKDGSTNRIQKEETCGVKYYEYQLKIRVDFAIPRLVLDKVKDLPIEI